MIWKTDSSNEFDSLFFSKINKENTNAKTCCENSEVHIYAHKWGENFSSGWIWCSKCGKYSHIDGFRLSQEWNNLDSIDEDELCDEPSYLEEHKEEIDNFFKAL